MNIITWKAYLRNSYYEYELARNLASPSNNQNIHSRSFVQFVSVCRPSASDSVVAYKRDFFQNMASENSYSL